MTKGLGLSFALSAIGGAVLFTDGMRGDGFQPLHWWGYVAGVVFFSAIGYMIVAPFVKKK